MYPKNYIDLFAGCGGLSLGLHNAGWKGLFAIEKSPDAFKTLKHNLIDKLHHFSWPDWLPQQANDINKVIEKYPDKLKKLRGNITLVAGGPPCQGFSIAGRRDENDSRNKLINSYIEFVRLVKPKLIFFENVKGFTLEFKNNEEKGKKYSEIVTQELSEAGYNVYGKLVNFGEFGVPQKRIRFILIGISKELKGSSVEKAKSFFDQLEENKFDFLKKKNLPLNPTVHDAISDLLRDSTIVNTPDRKGFFSGLYKTATSDFQKFVRQDIEIDIIPDSHSFAKHTPHVIERLMYIQNLCVQGKNIKEEIKKELGITKQVLIPLDGKSQSPTITSHPDDLIHYCQPRILTVREYARIQSFPDSFEFKGKYTTGGKLRKIEVPRYTQIGNAIPPLFGEQSGIILNKLIQS